MARVTFCALVVVFSLIWSSAFIAGKVAVAELDPFSVLAVRFCIGSLILLPLAHLAGGRITEPSVIRTGILLGMLNNGVYLSMAFTALKYISPGWVTIIAACAPFMTILLAVSLRMESFSARKMAGVAVGFSGVVVMTGVSGLDWQSCLGLLLAAGGTFALALGTVLFRGRGEDVPIYTMNFWQTVGGFLCLVPVALIAGTPLSGLTANGMAAIAWLVVVTVVGMHLWLLLIRMRGASMAASYHLLNPVSALVLSFLVLGIGIRPQDVAGAALIGCGLVIVSLGGKKSAA